MLQAMSTICDSIWNGIDISIKIRVLKENKKVLITYNRWSSGVFQFLGEGFVHG